MADADSAEPDQDGLSPGLRVTPSLELMRLLGRGGMGSVWIARDQKLDREVAVKFIAGSLAAEKDVLKRFEREARIAAKVDHPHVVQVFDYGVLEDRVPFLVMELLQGEGLDDRLHRDGRLRPKLCSLLVEQVAQALEAVHARGIIHRDIKPANLFLVESGYEVFAKIVDFGIAKPSTKAIDQSAMTMTGMLIGTPSYMSPEQLFRSAPATSAADVWALSIVAYEALTGDIPFDAETVAGLGHVLATGEFTPPSTIHDDIPGALDEVFARALASKATERYPSAEAFAKAFSEATASKGTPRSSQRGLMPSSAGVEDIANASTVASSRGETRPERPSSSSSASTERLGDFILVAELGHGGMADVFLAVAKRDDFGMNKLLVVKRLRPHLAEDEAFVSMIVDEARLAARLNHPNVVQTIDAGQEGKHYFIAMEYLDGQPLHRVLSRGRRAEDGMTLELWLLVLSEMLAGLHYAHELSDYDGSPLEVVHRDVTPHNIFVTYDGQVKVMDFGIARAAGRQTATTAGVVKGKTAYMAPEQARGDELDRRVDIFAAGVLLWELATKRRLWEGLDEVVVINRVTKGEYPASPAEIVPSVPDEIDAICRRALAFDPDDRYPTAAAMKAEIDAYRAALAETRERSDLGGYVARLFAEDRAKFRKQVEDQMLQLREGRGGKPKRLDTATPVTASTARGENGRQSDSATPSSISVASPNPASSRRSLWVSAALGAVVAAIGIAVTRGDDQAETAAAASATATSATPPAEALVSISIRATPPSAKLTLDGEAIGNPFASTKPRDAMAHELKAEAEGFQPVTREIAFNRDVSLELSLTPVAASSSATPEESAAPPTTPPPPPRGLPPAPSPPPPSEILPRPTDRPARPIDEALPWDG